MRSAVRGTHCGGRKQGRPYRETGVTSCSQGHVELAKHRRQGRGTALPKGRKQQRKVKFGVSGLVAGAGRERVVASFGRLLGLGQKCSGNQNEALCENRLSVCRLAERAANECVIFMSLLSPSANAAAHTPGYPLMVERGLLPTGWEVNGRGARRLGAGLAWDAALGEPGGWSRSAEWTV